MKVIATTPVLQPPPAYNSILSEVHVALGWPQLRKRIVIGIDGLDASGKSSFASWLGWQIGCPVVHLDLFMSSRLPAAWRLNEVQNACQSRLERRRPIIVEGVHLLQVLQDIQLAADYLVFVDEVTRTADAQLARDENAETPFHRELTAYLDRYNPSGRATRVLRWALPTAGH
jgi:uridine kinase